MKNRLSALLASTIAAGMSLSAAQAADLPRRTVAPTPIVAAPVFTWTGFYVGANAGYGFSSNSDDDCSSYGYGCVGYGNTLFVPAAPSGTLTAVTATSGTTALLGADSRRNSGFVGGGQIGYNYQFTPGSGFVIGVEADAQYAGFGRSDDTSSFYTSTGGFLTAATVADGTGLGVVAPVAGAAGNVALFNNAYGYSSRNIDWFGTVRGRLGYAIDRLLIYGTGGLAFTDRSSSDCSTCVSSGFTSGATIPSTFFATTAAATAGALVVPTVYSTSSSNNVGWTVGGGVEYAFTNNLTAKLEGLYVNFDRGNRATAASAVVGVTNTGAPVTAASYYGDNRRDDFGIVRLGLNYKFSAF